MIDRREFIRAAGVATVGALARARAAAPFQIPSIVRYPYVQNVRREGGRILWTTREPGVASIQFSTDRAFGTSVQALSREFPSSKTGVATFYQHDAELRGLRAGTEYYYRLLLDGKPLLEGEALKLRTPGAGAFTFLVFGDAGMGTEAQRRIADAMLAENPQLVLLAGDIVYHSGTYDEYQRHFFNVYAEMLGRIPFFPSPGNHDCVTGGGDPYLSVYSVPSNGVAGERGRYYSFDWGNVHFVSLDSEVSLEKAVYNGGGMLTWLENDLKSTRQFWRIVMFHHPPYAGGPNDRDPAERLVRENIVPILERYNVHAVFSGHEHSYQRSQVIRAGEYVSTDEGIVYFTTGGGGADLYQVNVNPNLAVWESVSHYMRVSVEGTTMRFQALRADGSAIDSVTLAPQPVITSFSSATASATSLSPARRGILRIFGRQLSSEEYLDGSSFPPNEVNGTVVHIDGRRLPLTYVSGTEITALIRITGRGPAAVRVTTPNGWTETKIYF